jgi:transcription factor SPT20
LICTEVSTYTYTHTSTPTGSKIPTMATAQVARTGQTPRRRDPPRPSATKRAAPIEAAPEQAVKKRKLSEPYVRDSQYILRKHKGKPASMTIHLHPSHFRFENQDGSFAYDSPMRFILQHLKNNTVPHEILEELLSAKVQFYDGCLIVEVHNHRGAGGKKQSPRDKNADKEKFSMHSYNEHITPSPYAPYPSKAQAAAEAQEMEKENNTTPERPKGKEKDGPHVTTLVLHPTEQTKHAEIMMLARTPISELRNKKKPGDSATSDATAQASAPLTPGGSASAQSEKMAMDQDELYTFQADTLVTTEPPLYLEPARDADEAQSVLDMLHNPLHSGKPPSPRERKRTTAEVAADDAQAAEAERRMLIMDERIKPSARTSTGAATSDNQSAAASLGFSRFKTIEMVRQNHEKAEREKKEEEARLAVEKRQFEEQAATQQKLLQQKQRESMLFQKQQQAQQQRQMAVQQQADLLRQQQMQAQQQAQQQQQQANMMQNHGHTGQNNMMQNQQANFQHPQIAGVQGSPIPRQQSQTPMMQSSPMVQQGGFPMVSQASNTGAGSPARPASATRQHPGVAMARNASQQAPGSRNHTPQMVNTPSMAQAMPGRQLSQTPRLQPGSPDVGMSQTPNGMMMQGGGQMNQNQNLTPAQIAMLTTQRELNAGQGMSNGQMPAGNPASMTPEHILFAQQMAKLQQAFQHYQRMWQEQSSMGNIETAAKMKDQALGLQRKMHQMKTSMVQRQQMAGNASSPGVNMQQQTPQMGHAHPGHQQQQNQQQMQQMQMQQMQAMQQQQQQQQQQGNMQDMNGMSAQQQQQNQVQAREQFALRHQQGQMQLNALFKQHNGQVPPHIIAGLPPYLKQMLHQQQQKQQHVRAQAQARLHSGQHQQQQMQPQQGGGGVVGNEQYVAHLQRMQNQLGMQMGQPQQQQTPGGSMNMNMGMNNMQQFGNQQQQQQGQNDPLNAPFAAMANALQRGGGPGMQ